MRDQIAGKRPARVIVVLDEQEVESRPIVRRFGARHVRSR
jgi:hypothetical protein